MPNLPYQRLTGKRRSIAGYSQLWLGPDHVLLVNSSRIAENYQRFLLADIQALVITDGPDRTVPQILAILASILWSLGAFAFGLTLAKWFFGVTGVLFLALAVLDIARGQRCRCVLHTAVSRIPLAPVSRQRIARRFLSVLMPAIETVQGRLDADQIARIPSLQQSAGPAPSLPTTRRGAALVLFTMLLLDAILAAVAFRWPQRGAPGILPTAILGELLLAVMALIQGRSRPLRLSYFLIAAALPCALFDLVSTGRMIWTATVSMAVQGPNLAGLVLSPSKDGAVFASSWRVAAGVIGLLASYFERRGASPA